MAVQRPPDPTRALSRAVLSVRATRRGGPPRFERSPAATPYDPAVPEGLHSRLRALLEGDPVPEVRSEAARALAVAGHGESGEDVVGALIAALDDANDGVRRAATLALGRLRDPRVGEALLRSLETRPELWQETSAALATAGEASLVPRLTELLASDQSHVRRGALRAIAALTQARRASQSEPLFVYTDDEGHHHPLF